VKWELAVPARGQRNYGQLTIARGGEVVATVICG
jgi:hypothetical protein